VAITANDRAIDKGEKDISPEQETEMWARERCEEMGIDPDEVCADGGVLAWMVVEQSYGT
jgi:hypothetical protein